MTRHALISDIHGNLEALEAVLRDIERIGVDRIDCLGDLIDYGPDPRACVERVMDVADLVLIGNHEREVLEPDPHMEAVVQQDAAWTHRQLEGSAAWQKLVTKMEWYGCDAMATHLEPGRHYTHASAASPTDQYVWPAHECQYLVFNGEIDSRLQEFLGELQRPHGFNGHTHVPALLTDLVNQAIFTPYGSGLDWYRTFTFVGPRSVFFVPRGERNRIEGLDGKRVFINPGSVGQPRRVGDPRASWALYDGDTVEFRRIEYDWRTTAQKLADLPLDDDFKQYNIERLQSGI